MTVNSKPWHVGYHQTPNFELYLMAGSVGLCNQLGPLFQVLQGHIGAISILGMLGTTRLQILSSIKWQCPFAYISNMNPDKTPSLVLTADKVMWVTTRLNPYLSSMRWQVCYVINISSTTCPSWCYQCTRACQVPPEPKF